MFYIEQINAFNDTSFILISLQSDKKQFALFFLPFCGIQNETHNELLGKKQMCSQQFEYECVFVSVSGCACGGVQEVVIVQEVGVVAGRINSQPWQGRFTPDLGDNLTTNECECCFCILLIFVFLPFLHTLTHPWHIQERGVAGELFGAKSKKYI